eukprot:gene6640-7335_t
MISLFLPLIGTCWIIVQGLHLYQEQLKVMKMSSDYHRKQSEVIRLVYACHRLELGQQQHQQQLPQRQPWTISFHHLSYWSGSSNSSNNSNNAKDRKQILHEINGECPAGKVTAMMGPSGCGKTTLLKLLGGQAYNGDCKGYRAINHHLLPNDQYDELMRKQGFVAQHDFLMGNLTVWQTILFEAILRLPKEMSIHRKLCRAASLLEELGLMSIAHIVVGGSAGQGGGGGGSGSSHGGSITGKGISGGQRRRLSIAMALLPNPSLLFLDEPTSGLDAASSLHVVRTLRTLTRRYATTIVLTVHQPRAEVFGLFDSLLLLGSDGHLIYCGDSHHAADLLSSAPGHHHHRLSSSFIDYERAKLNPGDFLLDLLGLSSLIEEEQQQDNATLTVDEEEQEVVRESTTNHLKEQTQRLKDHFQSSTIYHDLLTRLEMITRSAATRDQQSREGEEYMNERIILQAEIAANYVSPSAYLLSAILLETPRAILQTCWLMTILYIIHPLNPNAISIFFCFTCTMLGVTAWQALISFCAMITDVIATAYSMLFLVLGSGTLFGGLLVRYSKIPWLFRPFYYLSITALTQRALISNDLRCCYMTTTCNSIARDLRFKTIDRTTATDRLNKSNGFIRRSDSVVGLPSSSSSPSSSPWRNDSHYSTPSIMSTTSFCPPGLEFTGDGSDNGNLGRIFLVGLDLQQERPFISVVLLFLAVIFFRGLAVIVLKIRIAARKDRLRHIAL